MSSVGAVMVVADASAVVELLLRTPRATSVEDVLADPESDVHVPALCDVEVAAALRRLVLSGVVSPRRCAEALADYGDLPVTRHGHLALLGRILELRENLTAYDAAYVALAERLGAMLLTADDRLRRAVATHTRVPLD